MTTASSDWVKLGVSARFRRLFPSMSALMFLAGASIFWSHTAFEELVSTRTDFNSVMALQEQLGRANAEVQNLLEAESSGKLNQNQKRVLVDLHDVITDAQIKTKFLGEKVAEDKLPDKRSDISVPIFGITSAYAASDPSSTEKSAAIFDRQTRITVMFVILAVIIAITAACFAILFFSQTADTVTFAKDTLKAAGGFYFGIMNAFLGTT